MNALKYLSLGVSIICFICVILSIPISIGYGSYRWVSEDIEFKMALWSGVKTWLSMILLLIPGAIFYFIALFIPHKSKMSLRSSTKTWFSSITHKFKRKK